MARLVVKRDGFGNPDRPCAPVRRPKCPAPKSGLGVYASGRLNHNNTVTLVGCHHSSSTVKTHAWIGLVQSVS